MTLTEAIAVVREEAATAREISQQGFLVQEAREFFSKRANAQDIVLAALERYRAYITTTREQAREAMVARFDEDNFGVNCEILKHDAETRRIINGDTPCE